MTYSTGTHTNLGSAWAASPPISYMRYVSFPPCVPPIKSNIPRAFPISTWLRERFLRWCYYCLPIAVVIIAAVSLLAVCNLFSFFFSFSFIFIFLAFSFFPPLAFFAFSFSHLDRMNGLHREWQTPPVMPDQPPYPLMDSGYSLPSQYVKISCAFFVLVIFFFLLLHNNPGFVCSWPSDLT